ncbi:MAG: ABC transporter ATP-binding protein [Acidobacteriaceae bacterium]|nr:ABC transporter ATP-binding protein [Acidobacteriaceae bacterium]MBV8572678.1 ABC transporter ATP-binding protein [Acidobacteriaceae bacterium]
MTQSEAVICHKITKEFGAADNRNLVLRGVDLKVHYGELTLLVGPSGCGKTTLISVIAGLLNATGGELEVLGRDMSRLPKGDAVVFRRRNLGFVFQQYNLLPALTAAENAAVPLLAGGMRRNHAVERAGELLASLGLEQRRHARPAQLSGGQQQRVALARALIHSPRLIVCDEPTSALDHETGHAVMELLKRMAVREDRAVIVVTHDARVFEFADRIAYMEDGVITRVEVTKKSIAAVS